MILPALCLRMIQTQYPNNNFRIFVVYLIMKSKTKNKDMSINEKYVSIQQYCEFMVFLKKKSKDKGVMFFLKEKHVEIEYYYFLNKKENSFFISTTLSKVELELLLKQYIKCKFQILEPDPPKLGEILDKISNKKELTMREKSWLCKYSMPQLFKCEL